MRLDLGAQPWLSYFSFNNSRPLGVCVIIVGDDARSVGLAIEFHDDRAKNERIGCSAGYAS